MGTGVGATKRTLHIISKKEAVPDNFNGVGLYWESFLPDVERRLYEKLHRFPFAGMIYNVTCSPEVKEYEPLIKKVLTQIHLDLGGYDDAMLGIKNVFQNKDLILKHGDISRARNTFKTAIIIAAGPSLNDKWDFLRAAQKDNLILVCDVMLKKCLSMGVTPHATFCTERIELTSEILKNVPDPGLLVSTYQAFPRTLKEWRGDLNFISRGDFIFGWLPMIKRKTVQSFPSVIPTILGACGLLKIKDVLLVGQDLSFKDDTSHADMGESMTHIQKQIETAELEWRGPEVLCNDGETRKTTDIWMGMSTELTRCASNWKINAYTCATRGAQIKGIPYKNEVEWAGSGGYFEFEKQNPNEEKERSEWDQETQKTITHFMRFIKRFDSYSARNILLDRPFRDLCGSAMIRDQVAWENALFAGTQTDDKYMKGKIAKCLNDILQIIA